MYYLCTHYPGRPKRRKRIKDTRKTRQWRCNEKRGGNWMKMLKLGWCALLHQPWGRDAPLLQIGLHLRYAVCSGPDLWHRTSVHVYMLCVRWHWGDQCMYFKYYQPDLPVGFPGLIIQRTRGLQCCLASVTALLSSAISKLQQLSSFR